MKTWFLAAALCAMLSPAAALATNYECSFKVPHGSWNSPQVFLDYDADTGEAFVIDNLVKEFEGKPVPAKVSSQTPSKITFTWKVRAHDATGKQAKLQMRMAYYKQTKKANLSTNIPGFTNNDMAMGSCVLK